MGDVKAPAAQPQLSRRGKPRRSTGDDVRAQILRAIEHYWREHRSGPSIRDIGDRIGVKSTGHIAYHLRVLEADGYVRREPGHSRVIILTRPVGVPLRGTIAAGEPLDQFDANQYEVLDLGSLAAALTALPSGTASDIYALRVRGASMIDDGILNGDYVFIAPSSTATNGAIVVAIQNTANGGQGAATLKRFYREPEGIRLQPANAELTPWFIPAAEWDREWRVQGTVLAVYREYA
jgi:repressor LexA